MTQNVSTPKKLGRKKLYIIITILLILALGIIWPNLRGSGTQAIAKGDNTIFNWKNAGLKVSGNIIPETCTLGSKTCSCNLSKTDIKCSLNFNFEGLNHDAAIKIKETSKTLSAIKYSLSDSCNKSDSQNIIDCTITYEWDKSQAGKEVSQVILFNAEGSEALFNLEVIAK